MSNKVYAMQIEKPSWINDKSRKRGDHFRKQIKRFTRRRIRRSKEDIEKVRYGFEY